MDSILIQVSHNEIAGKERLDYDLYNAHGEVIYKKGQKIDSGLLLMLNYTKFFKIDENDDAEPDSTKQTVDKLVREMILLGIKKRASKIFIKSNDENVDISLLIDETAQNSANLDPLYFPYIIKKLRSIAGLKDGEQYQEKDFCISLYNRLICIKFLYYPDKKDKTIIIELSETGKKQKKIIEQLGFSESVYKKLEEFLFKDKTVLFLAGESEADKMTLYSAIAEFLENKPKKPLLFNGIPEKIESEDENTINIININASNVVETVKTLRNSKIADSNIKIGILAQKITKKLCSNCKEKFRPANEQMNEYFIWDGKAEVYFYKYIGCMLCNNTGYSGQIPLHEFVELNPELLSTLKSFSNEQDIKDKLNSAGFQSYERDGLKKVLCGLTTIGDIN